MQRALFVKIAIIGLLIILLLIPLAMTSNLVHERKQRHQEVVTDIATSYAGAQQITGPVVAIPWTRIRLTVRPAIGEHPEVREETRTSGIHYLFPSELDVSGDLGTDTKSRGLFHARVYQWQGLMKGRFEWPDELPVETREGDRLEVGQPYLAVALDDPRGIIGQPRLEWNGQPVSVERGSALNYERRGLHAPLPVGDETTVEFSLALSLRGTERIAFVPVGDANRFELRSDWPHPSFSGRYLPDPESQQIGADGFRAVWSISALAAEAAGQIRRGETNCERNCAYPLDALSVELVEPVAIYTLSDRALKYAHLFIVLTFAAFFLFEALKRLAIHPVQYLLVGLALAVFFLLLISLSEHLDFVLAYALSALACCSLITVYLSTILGSRLRGLGFGGALAALFAALYFLLRSEDNALMLGSLLIFGLLAGAMIATRKVDWYALGAPRPRHDD